MKKVLCCTLVLAFVSGTALADPVTIDPPTMPIQAGTELTITYDPTCTPLEGEQTVYMRYGFNDFQIVVEPDVLMSSNGAPFIATLGVPTQASELNLVFRNDADPQVFDNNDFQNYNFIVTNGVPNPPRASISPDPAVAGATVTVTYDPAGSPLAGVNPPYMHYGFNGWNPTINPDVMMTTNGAGAFTATVPVRSYASVMNVAFNDTGLPDNMATQWDDNDNFNWNFEVTGTIPGVTVTPDPPVARQELLVCYNPVDGPIATNPNASGNYYLHWGINDFAEPYTPNTPFTQMTTNGAGQYCATIGFVPIRAQRIQFVFRDRDTALDDPDAVWDSNNGNNWVYNVVGSKYFTNELDGLYVAKSNISPFGDYLNIGVTGNIQDNGSAIVVFIDTPNLTGQTELLAAGADTPPDLLPIASRRTDILSCSTIGEGTILPHEFDYALFVNHSGEQVYFNQYYLSGAPLVDYAQECCDGSTFDVYAYQTYAGATRVDDGNDTFEDDQALFYYGGFDDTDTNGTPGQGTTGLEIAIPYFQIANGLFNNQDITVWVGLMPNVFGVQGQFSNEMLPAGTNGLCDPAGIIPLRPDLNDFAGGVWSGNTGTLNTFTGLADGVVVASDYGAGMPSETQTCPAAEAVGDSTVSFGSGLVDGENVTVFYLSTNGPLDGAAKVFLNYGFNGDDLTSPTTVQMVQNSCAADPADEWMATIYIPSNGTPPPLELDVNFISTNGGTLHDNYGQNWQFEIARKAAGDAVTIDPNPAQAGQSVTVTYDATGRVLEGVSGVTAHYGFNGWQFGITDLKMSRTVDCKWEATFDVSSLANGPSGLDLAFLGTNGTWDNNDGADWHFEVVGGTQTPWEMDGQLDCCAKLVGTSTNGLRHLYAGVKGGWAYVATESTVGWSDDHFIFIATNGPTAQIPHPWVKTGTVGIHEARLCQEADNEWCGWQNWPAGFSALAGPAFTQNPYLEGTFKLSDFNTLPTTLWIAHGAWASPDGGALDIPFQILPSTDGDVNLEGPNNPDGGSEFLALDLTTVERTSASDFDEADLDQSCVVDIGDYNPLFYDCIAGPGAAPAGSCTVDADFDNDGDVDLQDWSIMTQRFGNCAALDGP